LTVRDRQMPVLRARGGHGRRGPSVLQCDGDGHKLNRRVRPVHDDPCLVGKDQRSAAAPWVRGSNPVQYCFLIRGRSGGRPVTCDPYSPTVTCSCPPRTSGSWCRADPARTSVLTE
jgi:hypothetical protein